MKRINTERQLSQYLKRLRTNAGLSQIEAAHAVGTDSRNLRRWENGGDVPGGLMFMKLLQAYGVEIPDLPASPPKAVNAELLALRVEILSLRDEVAQSSFSDDLVEYLVENGPDPELRETVLRVAAREREIATLRLERAEQLEARFRVEDAAHTQ
jgi:transcriptional regulator with XRE-family HTH domain